MSDNIFNLLDIVETAATDFEESLDELGNLASDGTETDAVVGTGTADNPETPASRGELGVAELTVASNEIALRQSIMDIANGVVKTANTVLKDNARRAGGG